MDQAGDGRLSRRAFAGAAAAFTIVPRHVLGAPFVAPSDRITLASIGLGRQGQAVTMELLARPDVQVVAVCDCNRFSKDYAEYGENARLKAARGLLGAGYESGGEDLASPGFAQLTHEFRTSLGMGGREPAKRLIEAYYGSRKSSRSGSYQRCAAYNDYRELLEKEKDVDAVYVATPDHWHAPISLAAMKRRKHVLCQKPMTHTIGDARRMAQMAREMKVATSLPVNNPSSEATRLIADWIADGAIGHVREVHNWSGGHEAAQARVVSEADDPHYRRRAAHGGEGGRNEGADFAARQQPVERGHAADRGLDRGWRDPIRDQPRGLA